MSKETKISKEETPLDDNPEAPPSLKKRNWIGKIRKFLLRTLIYSVLFVFLIIASIGIVLEYYFPAEEARLFAEGQLTKQLKLPLKIQKLDFSLFKGLQLDNVVLGFPAKTVARVKKVVLDYDLTQLLQGKLVINQVLVDHPQLTAVSKIGVWNFQPLLELAKPNSTVKDKSKKLPTFPLAQVDIKELTVREASASLDQDGKINAHIDGLSLEAQGKANLKTIDLKLKVLITPSSDTAPNIGFQSKGKMSFQTRAFSNLNLSATGLTQLNISGAFGLQNNQLFMKSRPLPSPDLAVEIDGLIKPELLDLKNLQLSLGKNNKLKVSGNVVNYSKDPSFKLKINEASFKLEDLLDWGKQWAPPISGKGLLNAEALRVSGNISGSALKKMTINGGILSTKNLWINHPAQNAKLENMNADLKLKEVVLLDSQLEKVSINLNMQLQKGTVQGAEIKNLKQFLDVTAKGKNLTDIILEFSSDMKSLHYNHPETKDIILPVRVEGSGHILKNDFNNLNLSYQLGNLVSGNITGTLKDLGKDSLQLDQNLKIDLAELTGQLPKNLTTNLTKNLQGTTQIQTSVTGNLDNSFFPVELQGMANLQLEELTADIKQPSIHVENLNTQITSPFEFNAKKGIRFSRLDIHTELQNAKAMNTFQVNALKLNNKILMDGFHNLKSEFGTLPVKIETQISLGSLNNTQPNLSLSKLKSEIKIKTDLQAHDVRNTRAEGTLSFNNLSAMNMLKTNEWFSQFKLDLHDKSLTRIRISQKTKLSKPSFHQDDLGLNLKSVRLESLSRQNLENGNVDIDTFVLEIPDLVTARLKSTLKKWGKTFALESQVENLQLGSLWDILPDRFKSNLDHIKTGGTLDLTLKTRGTLPANTQEDGEQNSITPPKPIWSSLLATDSASNKSPVELEAEIKLKNGFLSDPDKKITAETLNSKTRITFKNGHAEIKGNFAGKLDGLAASQLNPVFNYHYTLDSLNILKIKQHDLKLTDKGAQHSLTGHFKGLKLFVTGQRPIRPGEILNKLDIKVANTNTIDITQAITGNTDELLRGIKAQGAVNSEINFHQSAGKTMIMTGRLGFDKFSLQLPSEIALKNLTGNFPFSKSLQIGTEQMDPQSNNFSPAQKKFFTPLRNFSRYKNIIRADALSIKGQTLGDIGLDVRFKDNRLMVEKFIFDVLGGSMGGNLFLIQNQQGPVLKFSMEFAGIDSSKLLAIPLKKKTDSQVDGNLQIILKINTGSEDQPVSLDQLNVKIAITRIGSKTLDRLLLFIDPDESKPAIMDTRAKLKLATPHRVVINLENGNLNVEAWLKSSLLGIVKAPELKRVPVAALKSFNAIHKHLQALKNLQQISNYLSAQGIQFKDEKMILHY
jgi:hypothetical protein